MKMRNFDSIMRKNLRGIVSSLNELRQADYAFASSKCDYDSYVAMKKEAFSKMLSNVVGLSDGVTYFGHFSNELRLNEEIQVIKVNYEMV